MGNAADVRPLNVAGSCDLVSNAGPFTQLLDRGIRATLAFQTDQVEAFTLVLFVKSRQLREQTFARGSTRAPVFNQNDFAFHIRR